MRLRNTHVFILKCLLAVMVFISTASVVRAGGKRVEFTKDELVIIKRMQIIEQQLDSIPEKSLFELNDIIKQSIKRDWNGALQEAYYLAGRAYLVLEKPQLALYYFDQSEKQQLPDALGYKSKKMAPSVKMKKPDAKSSFQLSAKLLLAYAQAFHMSGEYDQSNQYYQLLRRLAKDNVNLDYDYAIAQNHYLNKNYEASKLLYEKILEIETQNQNNSGIEMCNIRIAACLISLGETEQGVSHVQNSLSNMAIEESSNENRSKNFEVISEALRTQKAYSKEADVRSQFNLTFSQANELLKIAQSYYGAGKLAEAENYVDQYLNNIDYKSINTSDIEVIRQLSQELKAKDNSKKALDYLMIYNQLQDSLSVYLDSLSQQSSDLGQEGIENIIELEKLMQDKQLSEQTINHLMTEQKLQTDLVGTQRYLIYVLVALILLGGIASILILRVSKQRRRANQKLALRSLRTQMNPHFIFNALNSVNSFIATNNEKDANRFLIEFSMLMRTVMDNSEEDFIPLIKEVEMLGIYLSLEHFRFKDKFEFEFQIDEEIDQENEFIPPMLIQPYIENAIWHGLRYSESKGLLRVLVKNDNNHLLVTVSDNGIGREASKALKTKHQKKFRSLALKNIDQRVVILKELYGQTIEIKYSNLNKDGTGTVVELKVPKSINRG